MLRARACHWRLLSPFVLFALLVFTLGCDRLPDPALQAAKRTQTRAQGLATVVDERESAQQKMMGDASFAYLLEYSEREKWPDHFRVARSELTRAQTLYRDEVEPLLEENRSADADKVLQAVERVDRALKQVDAESAAPRRRADLLVATKSHARQRVDQAKASARESRERVDGVADEVATSIADYPQKRDDLNGRFAALEFSQQEADAALASATREQAGQAPDLAVLADSLAETEKSTLAVAASAKDLRAKMVELHKSYSKVLVDMKTSYQVQVGRTSWNDYLDFPRENEALYPAREVDEQVITELEALGDRPLFARRRWAISNTAVAALGINPSERLPRGDNTAELWIADSGVTYFHRYLLEEDGAQRELDWQEVDEDTFEQYGDDLGMEIVSKPYGLYEEEAMAEAAPPGMSKVGNPKYGRWEDAGNGRRRWSFFESYLFYHMMFGGRRHYYYYGDWNHWRGNYRGRRAYYGRDLQQRKYGTYGSVTKSSSRYAGSSFARRGGFKRSAGSLRGAGPRGRGGGPGGGGK